MDKNSGQRNVRTKKERELLPVVFTYKCIYVYIDIMFLKQLQRKLEG